MVETKTAKRKAAAKTAARSAAEINNASAAVKKAKAPASPAAGPSPPANRTRARQAAKEGAAPGASTPAPRQGKKRAATELEEASVPRAAEAEGSGSEGEGGEEEGQRLVVKLEKKQEKRLEEGLKKLQAGPAAQPGKSGVVYLGRIPFGFFEKQMRDYFTQFGEVARIRMSRNKKTGKPKHFAFIEFVHPEVADIVAETHDNMLICDRMVKCNVVPMEKLHETTFKGADEEFKAYPWKKMARDEANRKRTVVEEKVRVKKLVSKERKRKEKIKAAGIDYEFEGFEALAKQSKPKRTKFE